MSISSEVAQRQQSSSRRVFLKRSAAVAVASVPAAAIVGSLMSPSRAKAEAQANPAHQGHLFYEIMRHEQAHVAFSVNALGSAARPEPTFQGLEQKNFDDFANVASVLENTGTGAYLAAAAFINSRTYLGAAASIALIEGRHAGYLNVLLGHNITANVLQYDSDNDFELPLSPAEVVDGAKGFIKSLNGGPDPTYSDTLSDANDVNILNFALLLEYLERDFYQLNVPKFFG